MYNPECVLTRRKHAHHYSHANHYRATVKHRQKSDSLLFCLVNILLGDALRLLDITVDSIHEISYQSVQNI